MCAINLMVLTFTDCAHFCVVENYKDFSLVHVKVQVVLEGNKI